MTAAIYYLPSRQVSDKAIIWTLGVSITLHIILAYVIPNIAFDAPKKPDTLVVEFAKPKIPEPILAPEPAIEAPTPEPTPPKEITREVPKPTLVQKTINKPSPVAESKPQPEAQQPVVEPTVPPVITAQPKVEPNPVEAVPTPQPPPPPPRPIVSNEDLSVAKSKYGNMLAGLIAKHKQYPKIAQMRGWQGDVLVDLQLDSSGNVISSKVEQSSSYEALDKQALEMVKKAAPFPAPPDALKGHNFNIQVPVSFHLE